MSELLDQAFELLEIATQLEDTEGGKIEAATKYYEAVYLIKRYIQRLPADKFSDQNDLATRGLLLERVAHYEKVAAHILACEGNTPSQEDTSVNQLSESSSHTEGPASSTNNLVTLVSLADARLATALDYDESSQGDLAIKTYMEAAELYLKALRLDNLDSHSDCKEHNFESDQFFKALRDRLTKTLDRVELLKGLASIAPTVHQHTRGLSWMQRSRAILQNACHPRAVSTRTH